MSVLLEKQRQERAARDAVVLAKGARLADAVSGLLGIAIPAPTSIYNCGSIMVRGIQFEFVDCGPLIGATASCGYCQRENRAQMGSKDDALLLGALHGDCYAYCKTGSCSGWTYTIGASGELLAN